MVGILLQDISLDMPDNYRQLLQDCARDDRSELGSDAKLSTFVLAKWNDNDGGTPIIVGPAWTSVGEFLGGARNGWVDVPLEHVCAVHGCNWMFPISMVDF